MHMSAQRIRSFASASALVLAAVVLAGASLASDPRDAPQWLKALNARSDALNRNYGLGKYAPEARAAVGGKVTVRIAGTNSGQDVGNGSLAGTGHFTASGAITDKGTCLVYRTKKAALIILRYVTVGQKGTITFVVRIDTILATSRWTITSGTKAYKGLHGRGTEHENAQYTVSTLTGNVSH